MHFLEKKIKVLISETAKLPNVLTSNCVGGLELFLQHTMIITKYNIYSYTGPCGEEIHTILKTGHIWT